MYGSLLKGRKVSGVVLCQVHFEKKWERLWGEGHAMDNISPSKITVSLLRVSVLQIATSAKAQIVEQPPVSVFAGQCIWSSEVPQLSASSGTTVPSSAARKHCCGPALASSGKSLLCSCH